MKYHPQEEEVQFQDNAKLDPEVNGELHSVYRRMNFIVRLYNAALIRISDLEVENTNLKRTQELQGNDIQHIKDALGNIEENTKWTRRAITQALIVAGFGAVSAFVMFLIQRGF